MFPLRVKVLVLSTRMPEEALPSVKLRVVVIVSVACRVISLSAAATVSSPREVSVLIFTVPPPERTEPPEKVFALSASSRTRIPATLALSLPDPETKVLPEFVRVKVSPEATVRVLAALPRMKFFPEYESEVVAWSVAALIVILPVPSAVSDATWTVPPPERTESPMKSLAETESLRTSTPAPLALRLPVPVILPETVSVWPLSTEIAEAALPTVSKRASVKVPETCKVAALRVILPEPRLPRP